MLRRMILFAFLLLASWCVMTFTHELGHILGGVCSGGRLQAADLWPWHLPYSIFEPDPRPLVTLWCGPILGVIMPILVCLIFRRDWAYFIASFCVLANGSYIAVAWFAGDRYLDTPKLLEHGASHFSLLLYSLTTILAGYIAFRRECIKCLKSLR